MAPPLEAVPVVGVSMVSAEPVPAGSAFFAEAPSEGDSVAGESEVATPCGSAEVGAVSSAEPPREEDAVAGASAEVAS